MAGFHVALVVVIAKRRSAHQQPGRLHTLVEASLCPFSVLIDVYMHNSSGGP